MSIRLTIFALLIMVTAAPGQTDKPLVIGSKKFTESVILGEVVSYLAQDAGLAANHRSQLGGTRILWNALVAGEIDIYPEYTGTIRYEILANDNLKGDNEIPGAIAPLGLKMTRPLGFNNTYVLGTTQEIAQRHALKRISDLRQFPELKLGFSNEFMDRGDGWPSLRDKYGLPQADVRGLDHDLAYRALEQGAIHVIDLYATDAEIQFYDLAVLEDDLDHFPQYEAVILYRDDLNDRAPEMTERLMSLSGRISATEMIAMNAEAKLNKVPESRVAADFVRRVLGISATAVQTSGLWKTTKDHLILVAISLGAAILLSIPLGIVAATHLKTGQAILGVVGVIQTIPSLVLFVMMIPLLGIGGAPAVAALFLYSLLPIVRNTYAGLQDIPIQIHESAVALGLPRFARLRLISLPMASRSILAGIKTSAVINVGTATLGAIIGAGGYGQPILTGIRLADTGTILQGAVPAAVLALLVQGFFEGVERWFVPRGLRLRKARQGE